MCKETIPVIAGDPTTNSGADPEVSGDNVSRISAQQLIVAAESTKYYYSIGCAMTAQNMHCVNVLSLFKVEHEACMALKDKDEPNVPKINDSDSGRTITR